MNGRELLAFGIGFACGGVIPWGWLVSRMSTFEIVLTIALVATLGFAGWLLDGIAQGMRR